MRIRIQDIQHKEIGSTEENKEIQEVSTSGESIRHATGCFFDASAHGAAGQSDSAGIITGSRFKLQIQHCRRAVKKHSLWRMRA